MKKVTRSKAGSGVGVERQGGAVLSDKHRFVNGPDGATGWLQDYACPEQSIDKSQRGAIQSGRIAGADLDQAIINMQAGQSGQDVLHHSDLSRRPTQGGPAIRAADLVEAGRNRNRLRKIGAKENDTRRRRSRAETH